MLRNAPVALAVASIILTSGCSRTVVTGADAACLSFEPITFSAQSDSAETIRQVREYNAAFDELCEDN